MTESLCLPLKHCKSTIVQLKNLKQFEFYTLFLFESISGYILNTTLVTISFLYISASKYPSDVI